MARPQKYDRQSVVISALNLFWAQGYHTTNLPQLLECTGLSSSSFYSGFGDKRGLFIECFEFYAGRVDKVLEIIRTYENPASAIYLYFDRTLFPPAIQRDQTGCFVINTLMEFEGVDEALCDLARKQLADTDQAFMECFALAKKAGNLSSDLELAEIVALINSLGSGIQVRRRAGLSRAEVKFILDGFIKSIGGQPVPTQELKSTDGLRLVQR
jgi:TetR/AcrR family transcriptional repressor of nem operon